MIRRALTIAILSLAIGVIGALGSCWAIAFLNPDPVAKITQDQWSTAFMSSVNTPNYPSYGWSHAPGVWTGYPPRYSAEAARSRPTPVIPDWAYADVAATQLVVVAYGWPMPAMRYAYDCGPRWVRGYQAAGAIEPAWEATLFGTTYPLPTHIYAAGFAINAILFAAASAVLCTLPLVIRPIIRARKGRCPHCGYDRRGIAVGAVCPECGRAAK